MPNKESPGETLYVAMQDADWHNTDHKDYDELDSGERRSWEHFAQRVIDEHCDECPQSP